MGSPYTLKSAPSCNERFENNDQCSSKSLVESYRGVLPESGGGADPNTHSFEVRMEPSRLGWHCVHGRCTQLSCGSAAGLLTGPVLSCRSTLCT